MQGPVPDYFPLLPAEGEAGGLWPAAVCWPLARRRLRRWWARTTDASYLASSVSRRGIWKVIWPGVALTAFVADLINWVSPAEIVEDVAFVLSSFLVVRVPSDTLLFDLALACDLLAFGALGFLVAPASMASYGLVFLVILTGSGVHSTAVAAVAIFNVLGVALIANQPDTAAVMLVVGLVLVGGLVVSEGRTAELWHRLQEELGTSQALLDSAGDGFCRLEPSTASIAAASRKLERALRSGQEGLVGRRLEEFLAEADVPRFEALVAAAAAGEPVEPVLVTCHTARSSWRSGDAESGERAVFEVEAKLIPHRSSDGCLSICIQMQGELRRQIDDTLAAGAAQDPEDEVHGALPGRDDAREDSDDDSLAYSLSQAWTESVAGGAAGSSTTGRGARQRRAGGPLDTVAEQVPRAATADATTQTHQSAARRPPPMPAAPEAAPPAPPAAPARGPRVNFRTRQRVLPHFAVTPGDTVKIAVAQAIGQLNSRGRGCCRWHISLAVLMQKANEQVLGPCMLHWSPNGGFQCLQCKAMNELEEAEEDSDESSEEARRLKCQLCGRFSVIPQARPAVSGSSAPDAAGAAEGQHSDSAAAAGSGAAASSRGSGSAASGSGAAPMAASL